jgi:hypothetical protein
MDWSGELGCEAEFFLKFSSGRLLRRFAGLNCPSRRRPECELAPVAKNDESYEKHTPGTVENQYTC